MVISWLEYYDTFITGCWDTRVLRYQILLTRGSLVRLLGCCDKDGCIAGKLKDEMR